MVVSFDLLNSLARFCLKFVAKVFNDGCDSALLATLTIIAVAKARLSLGQGYNGFHSEFLFEDLNSCFSAITAHVLDIESLYLTVYQFVRPHWPFSSLVSERNDGFFFLSDKNPFAIFLRFCTVAVPLTLISFCEYHKQYTILLISNRYIRCTRIVADPFLV